MIREKLSGGPIVIDLTGPQGNAFAILGLANRLSKKIGYDFDDIQKEMTSGDYENLLQVFDEYFGEFVILER